MRKFPYSFQNSLLYIFTGLSLLFPLGILMLTQGPTRYLSAYAEKNNWELKTQNSTQVVLIILFFIAILLVSYYVTAAIIDTKSKVKKRFILVFLSILLMSSLGVFSFSPELLQSKNNWTENIQIKDAEFHFGGYPDSEKLEDLKKENYTAVISLLSEFVVPAEPILISKEKNEAQRVGINLISIPMLPWVSNNENAVQKIKYFAKTAKGKYYVHCYLGKDRANIFKHILETENKNFKIVGNLQSRSLDSVVAFERGKIYKILKDSYLIPYPTKEEYFSYILNGKYKTIVSLMDPNDAEQKKWIEEENKILNSYHIKFVNIPYFGTNKELNTLLRKLNAVEKPLLLHDFKTEDSKILHLKSQLHN